MSEGANNNKKKTQGERENWGRDVLLLSSLVLGSLAVSSLQCRTNTHLTARECPQSKIFVIVMIIMIIICSKHLPLSHLDNVIQKQWHNLRVEVSLDLSSNIGLRERGSANNL